MKLEIETSNNKKKWVSVKSLKKFVEELQKGIYNQQTDETKLERLIEELEKEQ